VRWRPNGCGWARELHDSVTGAVTAMILYSAGARAQLGPDEERAHDALRVVERAGTQAMNELHRMLGLLRTPDGRAAVEAGCRPELAALDELVERTRSGGLDVALVVDGQARQLDPSVDQAGYRVVQEALTNATKHAGPGARVEVTLTWRSTDLLLDIRSTGEREVLVLMAEGRSNAEISAQLFVSDATTRTHVMRIIGKTGSRDRTQAVVLAYQSGLMS